MATTAPTAPQYWPKAPGTHPGDEVPYTPAGWYPAPESPNRQRHWDGTDWTGQVREFASPEARKAALAAEIQKWVGSYGWSIQSQSDFQAVITQGKPINNTAYLILTIVTFGLFGIVWIIRAIFGGMKQRLITVDDQGEVTVSKKKRAA